MCSRLSGTPQKQPTKLLHYFKSQLDFGFVFFRLSYRLTVAKYSFKKDLTFTNFPLSTSYQVGVTHLHIHDDGYVGVIILCEG